MDTILDVFGNMLSDSNTLFMALLIFLAAGTLAFSLMAAVRVRGAVKKRTSRIMNDDERRGHGRSLQDSSAKALGKLIDYTTKHYSDAYDERRHDVLVDGRGGRSRGLCRPEHVYRQAHQGAGARAPLGLSGFHGSSCRVRGLRPVDGSIAGARRPGNRPGLS